MPRIKSTTTEKKPTKKAISPELQNLVNTLNKKYGDNTVTIGVPKHKEITQAQRIPTGSPTLDVALGGGIPEGRFIEISGKESSTKTTQTCHIIANAQKKGYIVAWADVEGTSDDKYFRQLGVDPDRMIYFRPDSTEEATECLLQLQRSGEVQVGVLDSIAQMTPNIEANSKMDETVRMGVPQQLLGEFLRKWNANNNRLEREGKTPFTLIGINQLRDKIGAYGDPEYTPGGNAKNYSASVTIRLRRGDWITEGKGDSKRAVGQVTKFLVAKNKTYKRMQSGEFDFYYADNSADVTPLYNDNLKEIIVLAIEWDVIKRKGAWFFYEDKKFQGLDALVDDLKDDEKALEEIRKQVMELSIRVK